MKKILFLILINFSFVITKAQQIIERDKEIENMVNEVSPDSLKGYIKNLVAFGTRNTLSTQAESSRGIGAARKWVLGKFTEFSKQSHENSYRHAPERRT